MGAIMADEVIWRHPKLPWARIVYMAAASSTRDFRVQVAPVFADCPHPAVPHIPVQDGEDHCPMFYSLMLHPLAETHELHAWGIPPEGSLLEWIDEMFENERTADDRTFGKWLNVQQTLPLIPETARRRMTFRVFPVEEDTTKMPDHFYERECTRDPRPVLDNAQRPSGTSEVVKRCHPIQHGDFTNFSFWRDGFLVGAEH